MTGGSLPLPVPHGYVHPVTEPGWLIWLVVAAIVLEAVAVALAVAFLVWLYQRPDQ